MRTEGADLAVTHLAGREAGHHTVLEAQGRVDVIDRALSAAASSRSQMHHRRTGQFEHEIQVVNHQVEHHRHIVGTVSVRTVTPGFEHHHFLIGHHLGELAEGGVEALDVSHLEQPADATGGLTECCSFLLAGGDRLFDQNVQSRFKAGQTHRVMQERRHRDAHRLHLAEHVAVVSEPAASELFGGQGTALRIRVCDTDQLRVLEKAEHTGVMPAHVANPDHTDLHRNHGVGHQCGCANRLIIGDRSETQRFTSRPVPDCEDPKVLRVPLFARDRPAQSSDRPSTRSRTEGHRD